MNIERAKTLITASGMCFDEDFDDEVKPFTINLNDAFWWACGDAETIPEESLIEVADLFFQYGICGVYYWVLKRRGIDTVEFADINRFVEFVRNEERIKAEVPSDSARAYYKAAYTIGSEAAK